MHFIMGGHVSSTGGHNNGNVGSGNGNVGSSTLVVIQVGVW